MALSVQGEVSHPDVWSRSYDVGFDGRPRLLPGTGGVAYNVRVGDPACGWAGDHVEPGASIKAKEKEDNLGLNTFACIGNRALVLSGEAKGATGIVTGKHGGVEHVLVAFPPDALERLAVGDKVLVRARGQGLEIEGFPGVAVMNVDPDVLERLGIEVAEGRLRVPVAAEVPAALMGSGIGSLTGARGDYDLTTQDRELIRELGLDRLRLGDLVAVRDRASHWGRQYRRGAVEVGVVIHTDSYVAGHGPGVTTILSSLEGEIEPVLDPEANLLRALPELAAWRAQAPAGWGPAPGGQPAGEGGSRSRGAAGEA